MHSFSSEKWNFDTSFGFSGEPLDPDRGAQFLQSGKATRSSFPIVTRAHIFSVKHSVCKRTLVGLQMLVLIGFESILLDLKQEALGKKKIKFGSGGLLFIHIGLGMATARKSPPYLQRSDFEVHLSTKQVAYFDGH